MATKYDLTWKAIYEIDSEFQSLIRAEKLKREHLLKRLEKLKFTHTQAARLEQKQVEAEVENLI